jgi:hypothetical protein
VAGAFVAEWFDEFAFVMPELLEVFEVFVFVLVAGAVTAFDIALVAVLLALEAVLFAFELELAFDDESPQAIPNAPITRTAESAITFFITSLILLS